MPFLRLTLPRLHRPTLRRRRAREELRNGNVEAPLWPPFAGQAGQLTCHPSRRGIAEGRLWFRYHGAFPSGASSGLPAGFSEQQIRQERLPGCPGSLS
ncbi:hypothetical protein RCH15_002472 [Arthrobacter sp. MP_M4]|nr:hypothetical protein [Arthrobacter sp. MP_M4]